MKDILNAFNREKDDIFAKIPISKNIYSVEIKFIYPNMKSLEKELKSLQKRNPGPLTVFNFIDENNLLLRFESLCVIIDKSIAPRFNLFTNTDYLPLTHNDTSLLNSLYPQLQLEDKPSQYYDMIRKDLEKIHHLLKQTNQFYLMTLRPLLLYLIQRFEYPKSRFKDPSFFDFDIELYSKGCINKKYYNNLIKRTSRLHIFKYEDFFILSEKNFSHHYHKCIYWPTLTVLFLKNFNESKDNYSDKEINFYERNDFWLFAECYGYCVYKTISSKKDKNGSNSKKIIVYKYYPQSDSDNYRLIVNDLRRLLTVIRISFSLDYLHSNGYIYINLKDTKILLDSEGLAYLSNFCYTMKIGDVNDPEIGAPIFMAPERTKSELYLESDIYSFGRIILYLFNGSLTPQMNELNKNYGFLNDVVNRCLKVNKDERPSIKEIINSFDKIIDTFPMGDSDKQIARDHLKKLKIGCVKFINGNSLFNSGSSFLSDLFNINLYNVVSLDPSNKLIMDSFFENTFSPFVILNIQLINDSPFLIIAFELSCLIVKFSLLLENENFYLNKILEILNSSIQVFLISKENKKLVNSLFGGKIEKKNVIIDNIFLEMIEKVISLSRRELTSLPEVLQKIFPSVIGFSINRFYFQSKQFNDSYFFDYQEFQDFENKLSNKDFYCLKKFDENRYISYCTKTNQLFSVIVSKDCSNPKFKSSSKYHPCLAKYLGSIESENESVCHYFEKFGDFSLNDYLCDQNNNILEDPTFRSKIFIDILYSFDYINKQNGRKEYISNYFVTSRNIFVDQFNEVKLVFFGDFEREMIKESITNILLILLSLYCIDEHKDYSYGALSDDFISKSKETVDSLLIKIKNQQMSDIYHAFSNYENEIGEKYNRNNLVSDLIKFVHRNRNFIEKSKQNFVLDEFKKFSDICKNTLDEKDCGISMKFRNDKFFKDPSLPNCIKEFSIYSIRSSKSFLIQKILQKKITPFITFFLGKINLKMTLILTFEKTILIYDLSDVETFSKNFMSHLKDKTFFSIRDVDLKVFSAYFPDYKVTVDEKLLPNVSNISKNIYSEKNYETIEYKSFKTVIFYLIKRFEYRSSDFEDNSFFTPDFNKFMTFYQNDFFHLYSIGSGSTSRISLVIYKQTFHLLAVKHFHSCFKDLYYREREVYESTYVDLSPFITRCYGYVKNTLNLVFEYMVNGNLSEVREKKLIDNTSNTKIVLRLLSSLDYIHSKKLIYKDLKPENILLNRDLEPFLCDLGAVAFDDEITFTYGNFLFAAPEFLSKGIITKPDKNQKLITEPDKNQNLITEPDKNQKLITEPNKIDVYSFGILLFYICTNNEDFLKSSNRKKPATLPTQFSMFQDIYIKCTQYDPKLRYESIDLLFEIIYNEIYFPETNKESIEDLIKTIIENNFKINNSENNNGPNRSVIYEPFFISKGILRQKDLNLAFQQIQKNEKEIILNKYLCFELGNLYCFEFNDFKKAWELYEKAGNDGNDKAINLMGLYYYKRKKIEKSIEYFDQAKELNSNALNNYAFAKLFGLAKPSKEDLETGIESLKKSANEMNKKESLITLGDLYCNFYKTRNSILIQIDYEKAAKCYLNASLQNYDIAFIRLALLCINQNNFIFSKDANYYFKKAVKIKKSIETYRIIYKESNTKFACDDDLYMDCLNNLKEHFQLAKLYYEQKDYQKAKEYFEKASKQSNSSASNYLGIIYYNFEKDQKLKAFKYFKKASKDSQNIIALYNLGLMYLNYKKSIRKSIHYFTLSATKMHFKSNLKLAQIYENIHIMKRAINYYENALKINKSSPFILNRLGVIYAVGKGVGNDFSKAKEYFEKASEFDFSLARNNQAVLLNYFYKRESEAYGIFFSLERDKKFILASCNIGFLYEKHDKIFDSIPFFEKAFLNFKENFLNANVFFENKEEKDCLCLVMLLSYLITLKYYLEDVLFANSKNIFNSHLNDVLTFYLKFNLKLIINEINIKYNILDEDMKIDLIFRNYNLFRIPNSNDFQFTFSVENKHHFLNVLVRYITALKNEISFNNYEILFCSRSKSKFISKNFLPIGSIASQIKNILSNESTEISINSPIYLKFNDLYPNEIMLSEILSKIIFVFIQKVDLEIERKIGLLSQNANFLFFVRTLNALTILINDYFLYFFIKDNVEMNSILSIFERIPQISVGLSKDIKDEFEAYKDYINRFVLEENDEYMKKHFIHNVSYYSILFNRFYSNSTEFKKYDALDLIKLKSIKNNKFKVIDIQSNYVFTLKEIRNKEQRNFEIKFYSEFEIFQTKMIVPRLLGKVENDNSLLFEYFDNFSDYVAEKWNRIDDTQKTIIFVKIVLLVNQLHSNGFILCGLQTDSFLIREKSNGDIDVLIDDLYHYLTIDYTVSITSEFTSPEIKKCQKKSGDVNYQSDIYSLGVLAEKLGLNNPLIWSCLNDNPDDRPCSLYLLMSLYCNEFYFSNSDRQIVNNFIKFSIVDRKLFIKANGNRDDVLYLIENNEILNYFKSKFNHSDVDVSMSLLYAMIQGQQTVIQNLKIRDFFCFKESLAELQNIRT